MDKNVDNKKKDCVEGDGGGEAEKAEYDHKVALNFSQPVVFE
jgi:hypothetical protein